MEATTAAVVVPVSPNGMSDRFSDDHDQQYHQNHQSQQISGSTSLSSPPSPHKFTTQHPVDISNYVSEQEREEGFVRGEGSREMETPAKRLRSSRTWIREEDHLDSISKEPRRPLQLLDLPVDVLKDIVKEVTHTNDLTSLALCHSALHRLATPHIYSRFDIVWPDSSTHSEPRSGVDALTYGLATLCMAEEVFGEAPHQRRGPRYDRSIRRTPGKSRATETAIRRRRGNHYAQFTRKFSLGNGPADWVSEYLITKEGGKMLGTLVALAVARMRALETFVWDMPTGILRDVWAALSSLGDRADGLECRLEKIWIRFHNNHAEDALGSLAAAHPPSLNLAGLQPPALPTADGANGNAAAYLDAGYAALDRVESPSFSILPPMKSLSVLEIDELAYLDELAVLIEGSTAKLRELRIGVARHVQDKKWVKVWDGDLQQIDRERPETSLLSIGEKRLGGVLGVLTGLVHDIRKPQFESPKANSASTKAVSSQAASSLQHNTQPPAFSLQDPFLSRATTLVEKSDPDAEFLTLSTPKSPSFMSTSLASPLDLSFPPPDADHNELLSKLGSVTIDERSIETPPTEPHANQVLPQEEEPSHLTKVLHLETLELERVPLSVLVLQKALDWTRLTTLTILNCANHEQLWKTLRRDFAPTPTSPLYHHPSPRRRQSSATTNTPRKSLPRLPDDTPLTYPLRLKRIHTTSVSPALILFLKETLAPNSLEELYLQDSSFTSVPIEAIYRGPLRRHRASLKKLLIDSSELNDVDGMPSEKWRRWMLTREVLAFVCGGKMPVLRELGMAIDYRDWHFLLQSLPNMPHLRSLYIPYLADHVHGSSVDPRELALQFVDIVALRPEVELCYMGIANKCFEILENRRWGGRKSGLGGAGGGNGRGDDDGLGGDAAAAANHQLHGQHHPQNPFLHGAAAAAAAAAGGEDEHDTEPDSDSDDNEAHLDDPDDEEDEDEEEEMLTDSEASENDDDASDGASDDTGYFSVCSTSSRLRLREILFYDDKVSVFKARHGRL